MCLLSLALWCDAKKTCFFDRPKINEKSLKIGHAAPKGRFCRSGSSAGGRFLARRVPGAASRARTSKEKNDRGAVGARSDTPWAVGLANFCIRLIIALFISFGLRNYPRHDFVLLARHEIVAMPL